MATENPKYARWLALLVLVPAVFLMLLLFLKRCMSGLDYVLLSVLGILLAAGVIRRDQLAFRVMTVLLFSGTLFFCIFSLDAFVPRYASSTSQWSEAFRDGILRAMDCARPYFPYIILSSTGLALLALLGPTKSSGETGGVQHSQPDIERSDER